LIGEPPLYYLRSEQWQGYYGWVHGEGGAEAVLGYLRSVDLSKWNPKAPPPKTSGFYTMVEASRGSQTAGILDALDELANPEVLTIGDIAQKADSETAQWLPEPRQRDLGRAPAERGRLQEANQPGGEVGTVAGAGVQAHEAQPLLPE